MLKICLGFERRSVVRGIGTYVRALHQHGINPCGRACKQFLE